MENKKITVVNATGLYPPQVGGPATRSVLFENYLPEKGIDVRTVAFTPYLKYPTGIRHFLYLLKLFKTTKGVNLLISQDAATVGLPAFIVSTVLRKPLIYIFVGDWVWEQSSARLGSQERLDDFAQKRTVQGGPLLSVYKWGQGFLLRHAEAVVVPSEYLKTIIQNWRIDPNKIFVIYNPFKIEDFPFSKEELRKRFGWNKKVVMSAGRNVPWKGFDLLREVVKDIPDTEFFVAHDLPKKELFERIKAADLFVLNTGYEGLSHQLLEVMSLGTPIVTTNVGGNPELIVDGKEGLLVPYNDKQALSQAIERLLSDAALREALSSGAEKKVRSFTVSRMIEQITSVIEFVCKF